MKGGEQGLERERGWAGGWGHTLLCLCLGVAAAWELPPHPGPLWVRAAQLDPGPGVPWGWTGLPSSWPAVANKGVEGLCCLLRTRRLKAPSGSLGKMAGETCLICMRLALSVILIGG